MANPLPRPTNSAHPKTLQSQQRTLHVWMPVHVYSDKGCRVGFNSPVSSPVQAIAHLVHCTTSGLGLHSEALCAPTCVVHEVFGTAEAPPPDPTTTGFCGSGLSAISKFKQQQKSIGRPGQFNLVGAPSFWTDVCVVVIFEALDSNAPGLQKCPKSSIVLIPPKSNNTG